MTDKAPIITFKNLSEHRSMSEETMCFDGTMYIDGVRVAFIENTGKGGMTDITPVEASEKVEALLARAKTFALTQTWEYEGKPEPYGDLESYIDQLVADEVTRKDLTRSFNRDVKAKVVVVIDGDVYSFKCAFNEANCAAIRKKHGEGVQILNALPRDEALKLYIATVIESSKRANRGG